MWKLLTKQYSYTWWNNQHSPIRDTCVVTSQWWYPAHPSLWPGLSHINSEIVSDQDAPVFVGWFPSLFNDGETVLPPSLIRRTLVLQGYWSLTFCCLIAHGWWIGNGRLAGWMQGWRGWYSRMDPIWTVTIVNWTPLQATVSGWSVHCTQWVRSNLTLTIHHFFH